MEKNTQYTPQKKQQAHKYQRKQLEVALGAQNGYDMKKIVQNYVFGLNDIISNNKFSQIYSGLQKNHQKLVAIKAFPIQKTCTSGQRQDIQNQIKVCKNLPKHKNIVTILDVFSTSNNYYLMMQQCSGDLKTLLNRKKSLSQQQMAPIMLDILEGLRHMTTNNYIHCNIKPSNILINTGDAKITDFGVARTINAESGGKQDFRPNQWTPYMSALTLVTKTFNQNNDAWSFAVLVYECLHGYQRYPWKFQIYSQLLQKIYEGNIQYSRKLSNEIVQFLNRCLNPKTNYSVFDLYNDPYIKKLIQRKKGIQILDKKQFPSNQMIRFNSQEKHSPQINPNNNLMLGNKVKQFTGIVQPQIKKTISNSETIQSPNKIKSPCQTYNKRLNPRQILDCQVSFMRLINIIIKQDQKSSISIKQGSKQVHLQDKRQLDHKFFRFVLIKQDLIQKQSLKMTLNSYKTQNPFNIQNLEEYFSNGQNRQSIESFRNLLKDYDRKYEPLEKQMLCLIIQLTQNLSKTEREWRPRDILNTKLQRKQIIPILAIRLSRQSCKYLWRDIQNGMSFLIDPKTVFSQGHRQQFVSQIEQKCLRLDFLMTFYVLNCLLVDEFSNPSYFCKNSGLNIIMSNRPQKLQIEHIGLLQERLQRLQIV